MWQRAERHDDAAQRPGQRRPDGSGQLGGYGFVYVDDTASNPGFWFSGVANPITAQRVSPCLPKRMLCKASIFGPSRRWATGKFRGNLILATDRMCWAKPLAPSSRRSTLETRLSANSAADYLASLVPTMPTGPFTTTSTPAKWPHPAHRHKTQRASTASTATTTQINFVEPPGAPARPDPAPTDSAWARCTWGRSIPGADRRGTYLKQLDLASAAGWPWRCGSLDV